MTTLDPATQPRRLACAHCGTEFACNLAGGCWCNDASFRLPLPTSASADCLCPDCLRRLAQEQQQQQQ